LILNKLEETFKQGEVDLCRPEDVQRLTAALDCQCGRAGDVLTRLARFVNLDPRLPDQDAKKHRPGADLNLSPTMTRHEILDYLESIRSTHPSADLAFYAYRDLSRTDWAPFLKAAVERNPVSVKGLEGKSDDEVVQWLEALPNESIYDGTRLAQPDEVWNYRRGDGLEKALCLANLLKARHPGLILRLEIQPGSVVVSGAGPEIRWTSAKPLQASLTV
jgi:hypothetical protein